KTVVPNQWNHVAVTYDGSNTIAFYINGQAAGSVSGNFYNYIINSFTIGGNVIGGTTTEPSFNGLIDEVAFFNRNLSPAEIQSIYNAGSASLHKTIAGSASVTVTAAAASVFVITGPSAVSAGVGFSITVTAHDAYGNVATGYTGTVHFKSTDS